MIDWLVGTFSGWIEGKDHVAEADALFSKQSEYVEDSTVAYVLLDPWHASPSLMNRLKRKIINHGFSYCHYSPSPHILSADVAVTRQRFEQLSASMRADLETETRLHGIRSFVVIGVSLSCVTASMVASANPLISQLIMVVPGHCLAESLWNGLRTKRIRRTMEMNGIHLPKLQREWSALAPEYYLPTLSNKKMDIIISCHDRIIPYACGRKYADAAQRLIPHVNVHENRFLGHYASILHYCWIGNGM